MTAQVLMRSAFDEPTSTLVDISTQLTVGEWLTSATGFVLSPNDNSITITQCYVSGSNAIFLEVDRGSPDTLYSLTLLGKVDRPSSGGVLRDVLVPIMVSVTAEIPAKSSDFPSVDPSSFSGTIEELVAGDSASGKANFMLPAGLDVSGGNITWSLLDKTGTLYAQGNATDYLVESTNFHTLVSGHAIINAPSAMPPTSDGSSYQIRWALTLPGSVVPIFTFEAVRVTGLTSAPEGPETSIEMENDFIGLGTVTQKLYSQVRVEIYNHKNQRLVNDNVLTVNRPVKVAAGYYYSSEINPSNVSPTGVNPFRAQLDPYIVTWKYLVTGSNQVTRQTSELFIVNSSILSAIEDSRRMVMKARTTMFGFQDALFDDATVLSWLRRGRDLFNSASGMLTEFSMTKATGGIREYWLRYAEVSMLRAQALAEGEKAFNFSGSDIQLDVDKTQYYSGLADTMQQQLDNEIKPFKQNLIKKSCVSGDGDMTGAAMSYAGASRLGISIHPASQIGRLGNNWRY